MRRGGRREAGDPAEAGERICGDRAVGAGRTWAREEADRLVLLVDEDGRLKCKAANQKATQLAPADVTANGKLPIVGAAVLMFQRGDELLGFTKYVADTICSEWL